jgi:hypothetical protein
MQMWPLFCLYVYLLKVLLVFRSYVFVCSTLSSLVLLVVKLSIIILMYGFIVVTFLFVLPFLTYFYFTINLC